MTYMELEGIIRILFQNTVTEVSHRSPQDSR